MSSAAAVISTLSAEVLSDKKKKQKKKTTTLFLHKTGFVAHQNYLSRVVLIPTTIISMEKS